MRQLTEEERALLDGIPQSVLTNYYKGRLATLRKRSGREKTCGHEEFNEECPQCKRSDYRRRKKMQSILKVFEMEEGDLWMELKSHRDSFLALPSPPTDLPGYLCQGMRTDRATASALIDMFGL